MMDRTKEKNSSDKNISIAIMASFVILCIQYLILLMFGLSGTSSAEILKMISKLLVSLFFIRALPDVLKRNKVKIIKIYWFSIILFFMNFIFFPQNSPHLKNIIFPYFFTCIPSLVYSYSINDWSILKGIMKKASTIILIVGMVIGFLTVIGKGSNALYSMSLSYYMLLPAIMYINEFLDTFSFKSILGVFISIILILSLGSRGAILCIIVFIVFKMINLIKNMKHKDSMKYILILTILVMLFVFKGTILENLYNYLSQIGIESRSIQLLLKGDIHLSGRDQIYKYMIEEIRNNPFIGIGIGGDRLRGGYSHNILMEIISSFGVVLGSIILLSLAFLTFKLLFHKNLKVRNFMLIWISIGLVSLMVSSSYITDFKFWIFLGLGLKVIFNGNSVYVDKET